MPSHINVQDASVSLVMVIMVVIDDAKVANTRA